MRSFLVMALCAVLVACGPGEEGPPGPQGEPGPGVSKAVVYRCSSVSMPLASGQWVSGDHVMNVFPDGGVIASCSIRTAVFSVHSTSLFRSIDPGAETGQCILTLDVDSGSGGFWVFRMSADKTRATAEYRDAPSANHAAVYSLPCTRYDP